MPNIRLKKISQILLTAMVLLTGFTITSCAVLQNDASTDNLSDASLSDNILLSENGIFMEVDFDPSIPRTYTLSVNIGAPIIIDTGSPNTSQTASNGLLPESVTYYKNAYRGSYYENVTFSVENDTIYLEITPDISDAMLTSAYVFFELQENEEDTVNINTENGYPQRGCYFYQPEENAAGESSQNAMPDYINENGSIDLTQNPVLYIIDADGTCTSYPVMVKRQTYDIPTLFLSTDSGEDITSRYDYVDGSLILDGEEYKISLRGRGNASWWQFPQKSYMLRFEEKISLFGMIPSEKWVLASTYGDLSLIRNCVAMDIASCMDHLEYTPDQIPVDVYLNGNYLGVYTFSEKIDVDMQKLNLFSRTTSQISQQNDETDIAFLLECGGDLFDSHVPGQEYFYTAHSPKLFIEYPVFDEPYTDDFKYISNYMNAMDQAITRGYGYEDYIDINSWVDWFIVMELTNNTDSAFCRSSFLYRRPGEKVMLGPVWDFDMAMGNFYYDNKTYAYWATAEQVYAPAQNHYMSYLYLSDDFMLAVQERWDEVKEDLLATAMESIDRHAGMVATSRVYNNHVRGISSSEYQVNALRNFIQNRYNWIDMSIHMYGYNRHEAPYTVPDPLAEEELFPEGELIPEGNAETVSGNEIPTAVDTQIE